MRILNRRKGTKMGICQTQSHRIVLVIILGIVGFTSPSGAEVRCRDLPNPPRRVCQSGIPSNLVNVPAAMNPQFQSQWCWAACISMVFGYYGHPVSQQRIVAETYGGLVNMPAQPWTMLAVLNRRWIDDNGKPFMCSSSPGVTNPVAAANDLAANMPLIIGTQGHAVVLTELEYAAFYQQTPFGPRLGPVSVTAATVRDPWPGRGRRILTPQEWAAIAFAVQIRVQ